MKRILFVTILLLASSIQIQAASKAPIVTSSGDTNLQSNIQNYVGLGLSRAPYNSASHIESFIPFTGIMRMLMCHVDVPPSPGSKWQFILADVGEDTPLTCTMDGNNPFEIDCIDAIHTYTFVGGRNGTIHAKPTGNPPVTPFNCSLEIDLP